MGRRVVITGIGVVTPLGNTVETLWANLIGGRSGIGPLTLFDASNYPVRIAAEVADWDQVACDAPSVWRRYHRQTQFALACAEQAFQRAGLKIDQVNPLRFGVYLGCGEPFEDFDPFTRSVQCASPDGEFRPELYSRHVLRLFDPNREQEMEPDQPVAHLAQKFRAFGPHSNCVAACVSSAQAIGEAARAIRLGDAEVMFAGGTHSLIHPFGISGFLRLSALSTRNDDPQAASRPFERDRDGFVMGEGAAVFVLEELDHALARGADIWGELTGYASAQDAYRITDTHPEGRGSVSAIHKALQKAGLNNDELDYINAHGTGTPMNDRIETQVFRQALGLHAYRTPVSSIKSMLGHSTTACAAIELAACLQVLRTGIIPPTINHEHRDPNCDLDYVPNHARDWACRHVLSNSIGFGGQNACLIVSQLDNLPRRAIALRAAG